MKKPLPSWVILLLITALGIAFVYIAITFLASEPTVETFDFAVSVNPESGSIEQGGSVQTIVNVTLLSGTSQTVTLSVSELPPETSATFNLSSGIPPFTSTLTIYTAESTSTGNHTIIIIGTGEELTKTTNYTLTVTYTPQPFNFSLSVSSDSGLVQQGNSLTLPITVSLISGSSQSVSLSVSGLPSGAWAIFDQSSGTPTFTSTMNISTSSTTPAGTYVITLTASGEGLTRTASYTLTVTSSSSLNSVTFTQTGLPSTIMWNVTFGGTTRSLTGSSITFTVDSGTYDWSVSSPISGGSGIRYVASQTSGSMDVSSPTSQHVTYIAEYELTISTSPSEAGVTDPASGSYWYSAGSEVTVSASPLEPFIVLLSASGWPTETSGNLSLSINAPAFTSTLTVTVGKSVTLDTYTIFVSGSKSGYRFDGWVLDENEAGLDNPITITMNSPHSLFAKFTQPNVQINIDPTAIAIPQGGTGFLTVTVEEGSPEKLSTSFTFTSVISYVIRVYAMDVENYTIPGASITLAGQTKTTNSYGYADFYVAAGTHALTAASQTTIQHQYDSTTYVDSCPFYKWDDGPAGASRNITVSEDATYTARYKLLLHFAGSITYGWEFMLWPPAQIHYFFATLTYGTQNPGHIESTRGTRISGATVTAYFDIASLLDSFTRSSMVTTDSEGGWSVNIYAYDAIINLNRVKATASKDGYVSASWSSP